MCDPSFAVAGTKAAAGVAQTFSEATAGARARHANVMASLAGFQNDTAALSDRADQVQRATSEDALSMELSALEARGRARASGAGLADVSLAETLQAVTAAKARNADLSVFNRTSTLRQIDRERAAAGDTANSRIAQTPRRSLTAMGFRIAASVLDAGTSTDFGGPSSKTIGKKVGNG